VIGDPTEGRYVPIDDTRLWVHEIGDGHPMLVLHGGPGLDHTQFRPWLDRLAERFRLIYVDLRSQGRSDLADPSTWTLSRMAADLGELAASLGLGAYAVLGQSFGSFVALQHAVSHGGATHYVLLGSVPSERWLAHVERHLAAIEPPELRERIAASWDREAEVETVEDFRELFLDQLPFHFSSTDVPAYREFAENASRWMRFSPDVLRQLSRVGYGRLDVEDQLADIRAPVLVVTGEHDRVTVPEGGYAIAEAVPESDFVLVKDAGHMAFAEKPDAVRRAIEAFFDRYPPPG
jgi:proline iminopeptidase